MSVEDTFLKAVELAPADRPAFLDQACAGDPDRRAAVEALLRAHDAAGSVLEQPLFQAGPTATYSPPAEAAGAVIDRYKLVERIGEGGMGEVWLAHQTDPVKRLVAIKVIKAGMDSRQVLARFEAERQALAVMDHPNIAKVLDGGATPGGRPYFVMELVKGVPITAYCDEHHLTPRQRLELFVPVCQAVQHAHQKGVIHRDLKPSNVLVAPYDGRPVPKVIDFGVAKAAGVPLTERTLVTGFGAVVGTPEYMSPEQAELNNQDVDTRSDVYSLGILLYELLTGSTPLTRQRAKEAALFEVLRLVREEEPPRPSTRLSTTNELPSIAASRGLEPKKLTGQVRGELDWIVMKALEKDRGRRYETANGFAIDVQRYLADEPVQACPPSTAYWLRKFARRNKAGLAFVGLALLFLVALGGGIGWVAGERAARRSEAAKRVDDALTQARAFMADENWPEAKAAAQRAKGLLTGAGGDDSLHQRLGQLEADLGMAAKLELARLQRTTVKDGRFADFSADPLYGDAFRDYGIPVGELDPDEAARRIAASAIREQLLAALVDWANLQGDTARFQKLAALVRLADEDPWRKQLLFVAADRHDLSGVARLAQGPDALRLPPARAATLANMLAEFDMTAAVNYLKQVQQRHPDDFWINHELAIHLMRSKPPQLDAAIGYVRAAVAVRRESPGAHFNLGNALRSQGDVASAEGEYREAVRLKPDYVEAFNQLGALLCDDRRDYAGARAVFREALRLKPDNATSHSNLGNALLNLGRTGKAFAEYQEAVRLAPDFGRAHSGLGEIYAAQGNPGEAIREYREAIRLEPNYPWAHNNLGLVLSESGDVAGSIREFQAALQLDPKLAAARISLGGALLQKGDVEGGIRETQAALQIDPESAVAHSNLGLALHRKGDFEAALAHYREAIKLDDHYIKAREGVGHVLVAQRRLDDAIVAYREAVRLCPRDPRPYPHCHDLYSCLLNLGDALLQKGSLEEGVATIRQAIRLRPDHPGDHRGLGNVLVRMGRFDEGIAELREAIRLGKDASALVHCDLAQAFESQGQFRQAVEEFRLGHELGSRSPLWKFPSAQWLRDAERLADRDARLSKILKGEDRPADAAERILLAQLCLQPYKQLNNAAARFYAEAFAAEPKLAGDLRATNRFNAACVAALAGCGKGKDAGGLDDKERTRLRRQALTWLRADLADRRKEIEGLDAERRAIGEQVMKHWLVDADLAGVRDPMALAKLPEDERGDWEKMWHEAEELGKRAAPEKKGK